MTEKETIERLKRLLDKYRVELGPAERLADFDASIIAGSDKELIKSIAFPHLAWMCQNAKTFLDTFEIIGIPTLKMEKIMRWLGFIQGCLWCFGLKSLNELREDSTEDSLENSQESNNKDSDEELLEFRCRLAYISQIASDVLGDVEKARSWLNNYNQALGAVPINLLSTNLGCKQVEEVLIQLNHGIVV
jgi:hypothetical protein